MTSILVYWESLRTSYWFLPALMTIFAIAAALGMVRIDEALGDSQISKIGWLYTGSAEGARQLLATVAGSMITVAGVVFSITMVALSLASNQFGPRLLRNFMRDRGNQVVLGTFIATFVYCLLVLRTVRGQDGSEFVPHSAVTLGVMLAICSVGVLIYYIHHAAVLMQAPTIIANVGRELREQVDAFFPEPLEGTADDADDSEEKERRAAFDAAKAPVKAQTSGYIQSIDEKRLLELAKKRELRLRLHWRPGHFVAEGETLASLHPASHTDDDNLCKQLRSAFAIGSQQTPLQDIEFAVSQLVEVAVRALSPGINDPFTAVSCIDFLGAALCRLSGRKIPSPVMCGKNGEPRVLRYPLDFADVADTAIRQIRQYGRGSAAVLVRLLEMIDAVIQQVRRKSDREALLRQALFIKDAASGLPQETDRDDVDERYQRIVNRSDGDATS